jgi:hypothetical protein
VGRIGSWWLAKVDPLKGERVRFALLANRSQSSKRAVGGKLFVTNKRCVFTPHLLDFYTGGKICEFPLSEIGCVGVQPAGGDTFGGGLRDRLRIEHSNGIELFVVNKLSQVIASLQTLTAGNARQ